MIDLIGGGSSGGSGSSPSIGRANRTEPRTLETRTRTEPEPNYPNQQLIPLATHLNLKSQLREERMARRRAEDERDQLKRTLADVLQGLKDGEEGKE